MKKIQLFAAALAVALAAMGQTPNTPAFEVASIKPAAPQPQGQVMIRMGGDAGRVDYTNVTLKGVLARAYNLKQNQISGPSWLDSEHYDIVAKIPEGVSQDQVPVMLQALLAERFQLKVHKETKDSSIYALQVGKGGPKLEKAEDTPEPDPGAPKVSGSFSKSVDGPAPPPPPGGGTAVGISKGQLPAGAMAISIGGPGHTARIQTNGVTLARFADQLSNMVGRPVVDETKIQGKYNIAMDISPEDLAGVKVVMAGGPQAHGSENPAQDVTPAPSLFTAVQQLGLRLDARKAPVEYLIVDSGSKVPSGN